MRLVIEDAEGTRSEVPFTSDEITLGRGPEGNTFRLAERDVSRRHARFVRGGGAVFIEDLGSLTGTRVNGERISGRRRLREGDLVEIGGYDLALLPSEDRPGSPPPIPAAARATPLPAASWAEPAGAAPAPAPLPAEPRVATPAPRAVTPVPRAAPPPPGPAAEPAPDPSASPITGAHAPAVRAPTPSPAVPAAAPPAPTAGAPAAAPAPRPGVVGRALLAGAVALALGFGAGWLVGARTAPAPPEARGTSAAR